MTNKLPIVGRYRLKNKHNYIVEVLPILTVKTLQDGTGSTAEYGIEVFNDIFEELPEDKPEIKLPVVGKRYKYKYSDGKNFKRLTDCFPKGGYIVTMFDDITVYECTTKSFWETFEELPEDNSQQTQEKPSTQDTVKLLCDIWKDASELPELSGYHIVHYKSEYVEIGEGCLPAYYFRGDKEFMPLHDDNATIPYKDIQKYCSVGDFINAFDQMQQDILELKSRQKL